MNLNVARGGMAKIVAAVVPALMAPNVITLQANVTVLQDGRYSKYS